MIDMERAGRALRYLSSTDEELAHRKVELERAEYRCDLVRSQKQLEVEGSSVADRKAKAETSPEVQEAEEKRLEALGKYEHMRAKRATEAWVIEIWRSLNANRRQGNVT